MPGLDTPSLGPSGDFDNMGGRGDMIKAPIDLQDLRRRLTGDADPEDVESRKALVGVGRWVLAPAGNSP